MKIVTGKVRASFVNVFHKRQNAMSGKEEYSMMILVDKKDTATIEKINKATEVAIEEKWGAKRPQQLRLPLRDGDKEKDGAGCYRGVMFMNIKSNEPPGIIDRNKEKVIDPGEFVSGDFCYVSINARAYDKTGNKGVAFYLNNIQVICKGVPLSAKARAEDEFQVVPSNLASEEWG